MLLIRCDCLVIVEWKIEDDVDGSKRGLIWVTVPACGWIVWGKPQKSSIRISNLWASNFSWDCPNTKQQFYTLETFMFVVTSLPTPICIFHLLVTSLLISVCYIMTSFLNTCLVMKGTCTFFHWDMATAHAPNVPVFCLQSDFGDRKVSWEL
jgi:hypothetical protein